MKGTQLDPRGLIAEAYNMEGIGPAECRTIFLDWVLGQPQGADIKADVTQILAEKQPPEDHPMTQVLREALVAEAAPRRRGGRAARRLDS